MSLDQCSASTVVRQDSLWSIRAPSPLIQYKRPFILFQYKLSTFIEGTIIFQSQIHPVLVIFVCDTLKSIWLHGHRCWSFSSLKVCCMLPLNLLVIIILLICIIIVLILRVYFSNSQVNGRFRMATTALNGIQLASMMMTSAIRVN